MIVVNKLLVLIVIFKIDKLVVDLINLVIKYVVNSLIEFGVIWWFGLMWLLWIVFSKVNWSVCWIVLVFNCFKLIVW